MGEFVPTPPKSGGSLGGDSSGLDAAKDILAAVKASDATALNLALQRHYETCESGSDEETEPTDDDAEV